MKYLFIELVIIMSISITNAQSLYQVFDQDGREVTIERIINEAESRPLIFFGELHNQEFAHTAEMDLLKGLNEKFPGRVVLGMEMFEADVQPIVDEYFSGKINQKSFETESRIWTNYKTDYKPMVEFAKDNGLKFVATNVPRRYANTVYHRGLNMLDSLSSYAKQFFPELPLQIDTNIQIYQEMLTMVPDHSSVNMVYSQGLKDATMAHFILNNKYENQVFLHINGSYHSKNKQGILSFLNDYPITKTITINAVLLEENKKLDFSSADFTIIKL